MVNDECLKKVLEFFKCCAQEVCGCFCQISHHVCGFTHYTKVRQGNMETESLEFCRQKYVLVCVLTNGPHFNSAVILFFVIKCLRLEDLVNRNVQQTVELNHWKKMCEEYSEESDRLEIECDVWRTKFLASR